MAKVPASARLKGRGQAGDQAARLVVCYVIPLDPVHARMGKTGKWYPAPSRRAEVKVLTERSPEEALSRFQESGAARSASAALLELLRSEELLDTIWPGEPRLVAMFLEPAQSIDPDPVSGTQPPSEALRGLLEHAIRQRNSVASHAFVAIADDTDYPLLRATMVLCNNPESVWRRVEKGDSIAEAVAREKLPTVRAVSGMVESSEQAKEPEWSDNAATHCVRWVVSRGLRQAVSESAVPRSVEFRGHAVYAGSDMPTELAREMVESVNDAIPGLFSAGSATVERSLFRIELRVVPPAKPIQLRGPRVVGMKDTWRLEYRLPDDEDVDRGVGAGDKKIESLGESIAVFAASLPADYAERRKALASLDTRLRTEIAKALGPALNQHAASMPQTTYDEKKSLAKWVNAELRSLGLAIKCPKTGLPAYLIGHSGGTPGLGRFQLEVMEPDGRLRRTVSTASLPPLVLMAEPQMDRPQARQPSRSR